MPYDMIVDRVTVPADNAGAAWWQPLIMEGIALEILRVMRVVT